MASTSDVVGIGTGSSNAATSSVQGSATSGTTASSVAGMIRNISQTVQEREIIKTAPDIVVFIEGLPYLLNPFVNDPKSGNQTTYVNFNDHVTSFSATYDTDAMVPNCTVQLQVPNYQKYLYQMPGGNNLLQTMAQIQVYAKSYFMAGGPGGDTVYRRVFKGVTSYIGYNDNGKTLEVSIQCHGIMHLLEKMQTNVHPSVNAANTAAVALTIWQSKYNSGDCFSVLRQVFLDVFRSDMFQIGSLQAGAAGAPLGAFQEAVERGYMVKWQAILWNMANDVHIFGPYKDVLGFSEGMKKGEGWGDPSKEKLSNSVTKNPNQNEAQLFSEYETYYGLITTYLPFKNITALDLKNSVIVNRLDVVREVVAKMDYEAYQDVDGKIIIKPPLYNLDVVNVGTRTKQTQTAPGSNVNSLANPATAIYEGNNPFVVYLSEILTEQESEDQSAIRRTRTTVCGNVLRNLGNDFDDFYKQVAEYIDISKMAKFGLREEPLYSVPWIDAGDVQTLFVHAAAETARANRGYRQYTFSIPMRPELKLGFPVYIPHKDMYAYIKTIALNFQIGGTATMTVTCDSIRRRVMVNTQQTSGSGNSTNTHGLYTPAPNLVYQWTSADAATQEFNATHANPDQSPSSAQQTAQLQAAQAQGTIGGVSNNSANASDLVGTSATVPIPQKNVDGTPTTPTQDQVKLNSVRTQNLSSKRGNQNDTPFSTYVIKNDGSQEQGTIDPATKVGYFCISQTKSGPRPADLAYIQVLTGKASQPSTNSVIPFTDDKGYELISPFPWGRWVDLNTAVGTFTQQGFLTAAAAATAGLDEQTLKNTDAFIFAGLGTPSASGDPSSQIQTALRTQVQRVGGSITGTYAPAPSASSAAAGVPIQSVASTATPGGTQQSNYQPDATVIVLQYNAAQPGSTAPNSLLNNPQPENAFAQQLLVTSQAQNTTQQLVNVLVSGNVSPTPTVHEALLTATVAPAQTAVPQNVQLLRQIHEQ